MPKNTCWAPGEVSEARRFFSALPGYPFFPCRLCAIEPTGYGCDHSVRERAEAWHPGLVMDHTVTAQ